MTENTETPEERMLFARAALEKAMHEMLKISYEQDGIGHMYTTDWVLCLAAESMDPGHGNKTFLLNFTRAGMATYQITGLLGSAKKRYENS